MVKITLEYRSIEEAVLALGKLGAFPTAAAPAATGATTPVAAVAGVAAGAPAAAVPGTRKRRTKAEIEAANLAAAGTQPPAATPSAAPAAAPAPAAVATTPAAVAAVVADAASTPKPEDAQKAMEALFNAKGITVAQDLLKRFGVARVRELKPEQLAEFIKDANATIAGTYDPSTGERKAA